MANNPLIYNAVIAGAIAAQVEQRWIVATNGSDYISQRNGAVALADAIDALIPTDAQMTDANARLIQTIVNAVLNQKASITAASPTAIVALYNEMAATLEPEGAAVWGNQDVWYVDPATGNDKNSGVLDAPLASVGELNRRLANNRIAQNTAVTLIGNQTEALTLSGLQIADGATLTIQGTVTNVGSGTISSVTPLGGAGTIAPWQLVTTGIDWTATTARRIEINAGANDGAVAMVLSVIDANTIRIGFLCTLTSFGITPTAAMTFDVQTLSTIPASQFYIAAGGQLPATFQSLIVRDLALACANGAGDYQFSGPRITVFGCELNFVQSTLLKSDATSLQLKVCRLIAPGLSNYEINPIGLIVPLGCVFSGGRVVLTGGTDENYVNLISPAFDGAMLLCGGCSKHNSGSAWFQNVDVGSSGGALYVGHGATHVAATTSSWTEGENITGAGICVSSGGAFQYHSSVKPTITGSISDTRIGGVQVAYAAVPMIDANNNAMMVETAD